MTSSWGQSKESLRTGWKDLGSLGEVTPGGIPPKNRQTSRGIWTLGVGSWGSHSLAESFVLDGCRSHLSPPVCSPQACPLLLSSRMSQFWAPLGEAVLTTLERPPTACITGRVGSG